MTYEYHIRVAAEPQSLLRVLGLFAQRWLVPHHVEAQNVGDSLQIRVAVDTDVATADLIAKKLSEAVIVLEVQLCRSGNRDKALPNIECGIA